MHREAWHPGPSKQIHWIPTITGPGTKRCPWPSHTGAGRVTLHTEPLRPPEPPSQICTCECSGTHTCLCLVSLRCVPVRALWDMYVPVCALLGKNERQLCSGTALQGGVGDMVVDQPGDALGVAVRLLHQRHVVACAWYIQEPSEAASHSPPGPPRAPGSCRSGSWERGCRAGASELELMHLRAPQYCPEGLTTPPPPAGERCWRTWVAEHDKEVKPELDFRCQVSDTGVQIVPKTPSPCFLSSRT